MHREVARPLAEAEGSAVAADGHGLAGQRQRGRRAQRHDEARQYYASALKVVPEDASVLSNLGLSYLLSKDLPKAEETLRRARERAPDDMRIRTNLAVVVGLQGRQAEAETIMKADLPPEQGSANVAALKRLLARRDASRTEADKIPVAASRRD